VRRWLPRPECGRRAVDAPQLTKSGSFTPLTRLSGDLAIKTVADDLLSFRTHVSEKPSVIFCMGDTLTHLPEHTHVDFLVQEVVESLAPDRVI
jgi:hypothetical protein